jgi:hypothetical protein
MSGIIIHSKKSDHGLREKKIINKMRNKFSDQYKALLVMQMFSAALFCMLLVPPFFLRGSVNVQGGEDH